MLDSPDLRTKLVSRPARSLASVLGRAALLQISAVRLAQGSLAAGSLESPYRRVVSYTEEKRSEDKTLLASCPPASRLEAVACAKQELLGGDDQGAKR